MKVPGRRPGGNHCKTSFGLIVLTTGFEIEALDGIHLGSVGHGIDRKGQEEPGRLASRRDQESTIRLAHGCPHPGITRGSAAIRIARRGRASGPGAAPPAVRVGHRLADVHEPPQQLAEFQMP